jgi:hypothetical protein
MPRNGTNKRYVWLGIILSLLASTEIGALLVLIFGIGYLVATRTSDKSDNTGDGVVS